MANTPNKQQQLVIDTIDGPVLCIAGPGSGKTKTLVDRVINLLTKGNKPEELMVATFTEKAAKELLTRISNRLIELNMKINPNDMVIGTLHSIFLKFLEEYSQYTRLKRSYRMLDSFEQSFLIYQNYDKFLGIPNIDCLIDFRKGKWPNINSNLLPKINEISEEYINIDKLLQSDDFGIKALGECYNLYQQLLEEENAIDFSSIQTEMLTMIEKHQEVLDDIQAKVKFFMIDEYQDTNYIQERILLKLASLKNNICVVGDDDQGLYRFRGASIRNILQFESNFAKGECKKIILNVNYRSYPDIVKFYDGFMKSKDWTFGGNTYRFEKTIKADKSSCGTKSVVRLSTPNGSSDEEYYERVYQFILTLEESNTISDYNQLCFLARSVSADKLVGLMNYLEERGIPVFCPRSAQFFERNEVKLLIGALFSMFPQLEEAGFIFQQMVQYYDECTTLFQSELGLDAKGNKNLIAWILKKKQEHGNMTTNRDYSYSALMYRLFQFPLFAKYLNTELTATTQDLRPAYNIAMLVSLICKFEYHYKIDIITTKNIDWSLRNLFNVYMMFIKDGGLGEYEDFDEITPSGNVSFMTIHQSKGLEFPITVVCSMHDKPTQHNSTLQEFYNRPLYEPNDQISNFDLYRLYYTAFSRAENLLVLAGRMRGTSWPIPSKYFTDIWNATPEWDSPDGVDLSKLILDKVKPVNIKHEYSFTSHVLLYERCPLQYKFYKELGFAAVRVGGTIAGTLLHNTIEDIHKAVLRNEENTLTDSNIREWFDINYNLLVKSEHSYLGLAQREAILKYILHYKDCQENNWHKIKEAEVDVSLVKPEYILKGTIDLIEAENGKVDIIDFKSGSKPDVNSFDPHTKLVLNQYKRQLEVYAHLLEQKGHQINDMKLYYPKEMNGNPCITFKFNPSNVADTIKTFDNVVAKIEKKNFSMKDVPCNQTQCNECDFRHFCHK